LTRASDDPAVAHGHGFTFYPAGYLHDVPGPQWSYPCRYPHSGADPGPGLSEKLDHLSVLHPGSM
jgi:hypothetical protein